MKSALVLATLALAAVSAETKIYPAGVDPNACPNYPFCGAAAPADFPVPVVNGEPVAPILNTTPEQTAFWQQVRIYKQSANIQLTFSQISTKFLLMMLEKKSLDLRPRENEI